MESTTFAPARPNRRTWRSFSDDFRAGAVRLVVEEGKTIRAAARELGLSTSMLRTWVVHARADARATLTTAERDIIRRAIMLFGRPARGPQQHTHAVVARFRS
jgi:transposase-like protein